MKRIEFIKSTILGTAFAPAAFSAESKTAETSSANGKAVVVFYSWSGNTRAFAQTISETAGVELAELSPEQPYTRNYGAVVEQARKELRELFKPRLLPYRDISKYDTIFLGTPNWWGTMSSPVRTFVAENDLSGKTIIPFITHKGSGWGNYIDDLRKTCPKSKMASGKEMWGESPKEAEGCGEIVSWVKTLKI